MNKRLFRIVRQAGGEFLSVSARGEEVLNTPLLNRGSAFTAEERRHLGLTGLLPPSVNTLDEQAARVYAQFLAQDSGLQKNVMLTALHDRNEVLFFRTVCDHMHEMMPIIYDPVIGEAIEKHSHIYRRPRGLYLSIDHPDEMEAAFDNLGLGAEEVDIIACSDAEEILGIGDWGVGGIDITIGKLAVYTAAAGIHPGRVIPVGLDVGTDRKELLDDPLYMGNRHPRVRGEKYDAFIDRFVSLVKERFPRTFLHWEDFGPSNARRLISKYRSQLCTFNDDMQGTGAITLAAVLSGVRATGMPLTDHRVVVFGAGTAGVGIADQIRDAMVAQGLSKAEAAARILCLASHGLLVEGMPGGNARLPGILRQKSRRGRGRVLPRRQGAYPPSRGDNPLKAPPILIGTSHQAGRLYRRHGQGNGPAIATGPMIFPLSNPTELHEAKPVDLIQWTGGPRPGSHRGSVRAGYLQQDHPRPYPRPTTPCSIPGWGWAL